MALPGVFRGLRLRAWAFIGLLVSQHLHAMRVKMLDAASGKHSHEPSQPDEVDELAEFRDALSGMTKEQVQTLIADEIELETEVSSVFRVDTDPGSFYSAITSQSRHYTDIRYSFVFSPRVLLYLYKIDSDGTADSTTKPHKILQLFPDSEITMKEGKHGPSVLVSGTELVDSSENVDPGTKRSTYKFRVEKKPGLPLDRPEHLQQLVTDLQTATIYASSAQVAQMEEPRLGTCTFRSDGSCWPRNFCTRIHDWKRLQSHGEVCEPVRGDSTMAAAWRAMMQDLYLKSQYVLSKGCMTKCEDTWFYLLSHLQAVRSVLDATDTFKKENYGELLSSLANGEEVVEEIETNLKRAIDRLPSKYTQKDNCKLPGNLEDLGKKAQGNVSDEDVTAAFKKYAKDCPELYGQVDEAIQSIEITESKNRDVSASVEGNGTELALSSTSMLQSAQAYGTELALSSTSMLQSAQASGDPVVAAAVICGLWYLAVISGAIAVTIVTAVITYMILKLIVTMLCATLSIFRGADKRQEFKSKCRSLGKKAAFGISVVVGLGVGIFFGGPFMFALLAGNSFTLAVPSLTAASLAPVTQAFWLGAGATNPGALYGIIAAYGVSAISWGGLAILTQRLRRGRRSRKNALKAKAREEARMKEWHETNGAPYPWKKKVAEKKGKEFYYNVEDTSQSTWDAPTHGVTELPEPWEQKWSDEQGRYWFWNPKTKKQTSTRPE